MLLTQLGNFFIALALSASFIQLCTVIFKRGYIRFASIISYMTVIHFFFNLNSIFGFDIWLYCI